MRGYAVSAPYLLLGWFGLTRSYSKNNIDHTDRPALTAESLRVDNATPCVQGVQVQYTKNITNVRKLSFSHGAHIVIWTIVRITLLSLHTVLKVLGQAAARDKLICTTISAVHYRSQSEKRCIFVLFSVFSGTCTYIYLYVDLQTAKLANIGLKENDSHSFFSKF